jgi:uncharacterized protein
LQGTSAHLSPSTGIYGTYHFWRTYDGKEIDYVEEHDDGLFGFECKWSLKRQEPYPDATYSVITPDNYLDFVG